jgi:signal transduction histidine kinase/ActR/RegA family two-component response regulator
MQSQLRDTGERLRDLETIAERLETPVVVLDELEHPVFENAAFTLRFPTDPSRLTLASRLGLDDERREHLTTGLAELHANGAVKLDLQPRAPDKDVRLEYLVIGKSVDRDALPPLALLEFQDRTEDRRLVRSLLRARRFDRAGRQISSLVHDLNNRLSVVRSAAELISLELPEGHPTQADLDTIRDVVEETSQLVGELAASGRTAQRERGPTPIVDLVKRLAPSLKRLSGRRVDFVFELSDEPLQVTLSPAATEEVILQLAANAIEATPQGGKVRIVVSPHSTETVLLTVEDHGRGIDSLLRAHLFEPFQTSKESTGHPGLGLLTVRALVEDVGGRIDLDSRSEAGAIFRVQLPKAKEQRMTASHPPIQTNGSPLNLLVLDDEEPVRRLLVRLLVREGYSVVDAATLDDAINRAKGMERLDVWVTDANVDGKDATFSVSKIRAIHPAAAVVLVSGREPDVDRMEELSQQGVRFLQKPFTPTELREAIDTALRHGSATSGVVPLASEALAHTDRRAP